MEECIIKKRIFKIPVGIFEHMKTLDGHITGCRKHNFLEEGDNPLQAIHHLATAENYWINYNQLPKEERKKIGMVFRLRSGENIEEILFCSRRYKNKRGEYTCGIPVHAMSDEEREEYSTDINGEFGMCCIEGFDAFDSDDCPYNKNYSNNFPIK